MNRILLLLSFISVVGFYDAKAQNRISFEFGATYLSNDADSATHVADCFGLTINPRFFLSRGENSGLAIETPISFRSKFQQDITSRFAIHLPVLLTYSIGSGSGGSGEYNDRKKIGATGGLGWGYFHQRSRSVKTESTQYNESITASGPQVQMGLRFPVMKDLMLFNTDKPLNAVLAFKGSYLFNLKNRSSDIGSFAILLGFNF
jgi:hypothetical protein